MGATLHVSDPGTQWTVSDPRELALRIRLRAVRMVAHQGLGYLGQGLSAATGLAQADRLYGIKGEGHDARVYAMVSDGEPRRSPRVRPGLTQPARQTV
ncbi:MAG TPA: hypothetical protein VGG75_43535 [Trebonia sp.]|jgi:transketolase N-terminal domain/subunit